MASTAIQPPTSNPIKKAPHKSKFWSVLGVILGIAGTVAPILKLVPGPVGIVATGVGLASAALGKGLLAPSASSDPNQLQQPPALVRGGQ